MQGSYLDVDRGLERCLLCIVALQSDTVLVVPDGVSRDGRMMTEHMISAAMAQTCKRASVPDLLANELRGTCLVLPFA